MARETAAAAALRTVAAACEGGRLERGRLLEALGLLAAGDDHEAADAVLRLGEAMQSGALGRPQADLLEACLAVLGRDPDRRTLDFLRACVDTYIEVPMRGEVAGQVRGNALLALHRLEPLEARFVAVRLIADRPSMSGEPARSAIAVLGAGSQDAALVLACSTVLAEDAGLRITALQSMTTEVPAEAFWAIAAPLLGDRFSDAVLAITDLVADGRRSDLLPGLAAAIHELSDPNLVRALLMTLLTARLDGVEAVLEAAVERAPRRALEGVEDALEIARIPRRDELAERVRARRRAPDPPTAEGSRTG